MRREEFDRAFNEVLKGLPEEIREELLEQKEDLYWVVEEFEKSISREPYSDFRLAVLPEYVDKCPECGRKLMPVDPREFYWATLSTCFLPIGLRGKCKLFVALMERPERW